MEEPIAEEEAEHKKQEDQRQQSFLGNMGNIFGGFMAGVAGADEAGKAEDAVPA